ncbi:MAG: hypothetical protein HFE81_05860 [Bacilli bacterium]|nr:hypothetical protein [Bacilli bacterium]
MRRKIILINDDNDYHKFLNRLKLYKSIFYHNTKFIIENHSTNNLEPIVTALNIKNRKQRIAYIYNQACNMINENIKEPNICGFKNGKCHVQRKQKSGKCNGCCRNCLYQSTAGCTTKNLACKLFNCSEVTSRYNVTKYEDIKILELLSIKNRLIVKSDYFSKEEDVLKDLYCYTLTHSTIRIVYRLIRNYIFLLKNK